MIRDVLDVRAPLEVDGVSYDVFRLDALQGRFDVARLPRSLKVLLENLLRHQDGATVRREDVEALAGWKASDEPSREVPFTPARVLLQDFTGVPAIVDLAAMRDALAELGGDPARIDPLVPAELVIDHSVQVDVAGSPDAFERNVAREFERNGERYALLRWGQGAFDGLRVVPPGTGIVHQVNLERLARVVFSREVDGRRQVYPDTLVGTDSHTTMVNALGVLGWGVGGIEAEAALLGQPMPLLIPCVVGVELTGRLREGVTATDLVLTVAERLRAHGVVGKFVEFHGDALGQLTLADRATIANMSPEYGSTCVFFPIDGETLRYLQLSGRDPAQVRLVEAYARAQGLFREQGERAPELSERLTIDLDFVVPCLAGPRRPQDRVALDQVSAQLREALRARGPATPAKPPADSLDAASAASFPASDPPASTAPHPGDGQPDGGARPLVLGAPPGAAATVRLKTGETVELDHGHVVIAAITSCTNTSNPDVMLAAALLARNAARRGLRSKPWVKTSLAPGSRVVMGYYERAGLVPDLEALGFHLVGFGCTTCIGNSGPLAPEVAEAIAGHDLSVAAVLSGNRNFEGRIHPSVRLNYLASPPLVVAYALAGTLQLDLTREPLGVDPQGQPVFLRDVWPAAEEVRRVRDEVVRPELFSREYERLFDGDARWRSLPVATSGGQRFAWDERSTYVRRPPFFEGLSRTPAPLQDVVGARVLVKLGDSITTDHISPAGSIAAQSPAGAYLQEHGVPPAEFNSYGSRRGNHEVMLRGTFANVRLRNQLAPGTEGGFTRHLPGGEVMTIYDAAMRYRQERVPLLVIAGADYGSGSSRDWAAKGTSLLGVRAVLAVSYERIHRSNLIGMGVLPLQLREGETADSLGLTGEETYDIVGLARIGQGELPRELVVRAGSKELRARVRIDSPKEAEYFRHGGILQYVLRRLAAQAG